MRRRDFLQTAAGAALFSPLAAQAQSDRRIRRIGVILSGAESDPVMQQRIDTLRQALRGAGWIEGQNYHFEIRWPASGPERLRTAVDELAAAATDVVVVGSLPAATTMKARASHLPIVFANLADPVGNGLVTSLAGSGSNITGFTAFEFRTAGKWLELLKEIAPNVTRVAMIFATPAISRTGEGFYNALLQAAPSASVEVTPISVASVDADTSQAIEEFAAKPNSGLISAADPGGTGTRAITIRLAARHRLPAVYPFRYFATDGGLAVYGVDLNDQYRRAAGYVDRILRGTKAADLPIQAPDKFELIFNLKAARAAGITIPPSLLVRADEVIE